MALSFISGPSPEEAAQAGALSPEALERRRMLAMALMKQGSDYSPIQSPWQGVARVTDAISGQLQNYWADTDEKTARNASSQRTSALLGGLLGQGDGASSQTASAAPAIHASGPGSDAAATASPKLDFSSPTMAEIKRGAIDVGKQLGVDPKDILTAVSYETAGTFDPWKAGPTTQWGQHRGLIQWGEPQRQQYGVTEQTSPYDQMLAAGKYLQAAGVRPGMGLMDIYSAINAGKVGRYNASDANNGGAPGTVADKVNGQMAGHAANALALLNAGGSSPLAARGINAMQDLVQRGPTNAQVGDLVQRGASQGEMMPAVQVASTDPGFVPASAGAAGPQASPFTPGADLKQGNFRPGSLTPAQAKQYADNGYNVPNEAIDWGQSGDQTAPAPAAAPSGKAAVTQAMQSAAPPVAQAAPNLSPGGQAVANAMAPAAPAAQGSLSPQQLQQFSAVLNDPFASPADKQLVAGIIQQRMKPNEYGFQSLPDGTILRTDPRTGTVAPIYQATPKPMQVGDRLVMPDGRVVADFSAPPTATVGNSVVNTKTGQVVFQAPPNQEYRELNGRAIAFDPRSGGARDVTPDGIPSGYRPATDQERAQYGVAAGVPLYFGPDGKPASLGPQTSVSIQGGESQFDKTVGEGQGKMFLGLAEDGPQAKADLGNIQQLRKAIATLPGGFLGGAQAIANQYGIKLGENAGNLEYANAILSKLTPQQRQGMPGAASDRDVQMFRDALPKLSNTPEGNKLILDTMEALANQRLEQARIATLVTTNQMNRQDGMKQLQDLPDPFAGLKAALGPQEAPKSDVAPQQPSRKTINGKTYEQDPVTGKVYEVQ